MFEIGLFGVVGLAGGAAGAWIGGRADSRFGPKPVIVATIVAVMVFSCIVISTGPDEVLLIGVGTPEAPSSLPAIVFYVCGAAIGAAAGPLLAASRTMLVWQADEDRMTEAFRPLCAAGKATSFAAPVPDRGGDGGERQPARRRHADPVSVPRRAGGDGLGGRPGRAGGPAGPGITAGMSSKRRAPGGERPSRPRQAPPPAGVAGSPLRMDGGTPGSFGLSANRRNPGGEREFADSRWSRHW